MKYIIVMVILLFSTQLYAWDKMPTPSLHIDGNKLKDPTGKNVLLHGWMQPTSNWFNGGGKWYSDPTNWNDTGNIADFLNYLKNVADLMSDTSPKYSQTHGWYTSFVRMNTDAIGGWTSQAGLVDESQFNGWINNFLIPYANYLSSRGLYLVLSATGPINTDNNGSRNVGVTEQARLRKFWSTVAKSVKNVDNIMFELMNEPVDIESSPGNGDWGNHQDKYFSAFTKWIQPVIDDIRATGSNNIIWVPTLEWQGSPYQWDRFPFSGTNIGVACHYYPAYGGVFNNPTNVQNLWNLQYKPAADRWPMIITELFWTPYPNDPSNLVNGSTVGFGNAIHKAIDNQGNVSYIVGFIGDLIENLNNNRPADCYLSPREGAQSYFSWLPDYQWAGPDDGTPKFENASVTESNPKIIKVNISHLNSSIANYNGFSVKVDNQVAVVDSVVFSDADKLYVYLNHSVLNNNKLTLSYKNGNVVSIYDKSLSSFTDTVVDNLLKGAAPELQELETSEDGSYLVAKFNMKMKLPSDLTGLTLSADYNGSLDIQILQCAFLTNDSTVLKFSLSNNVYADYSLKLSYQGSNIVSADGGLAKVFSDLPVTMNAKGLPMKISSGKIESNGTSVILTFSKTLAIVVGQSAKFALKVNSKSVSFTDFFALNNTIRFTLSNNLHFGDLATITYTPGNVTAVDKGALEGFSNFNLTNLMKESNWVSIPNKIEAENYSLQSGIQTENTSDAGGGLDVGWVDNGDWMEYATENNSTLTKFKISFRVASPNATGKLDYYLDNKLIKQISIPNTGGWQTWKSVDDVITIASGKHYLKVVASTGGFNMNYIDIKDNTNGIEEVSDNMVTIFPNPVKDRLNIRSSNLKYNKIEILTVSGAVVFNYCPPAYEQDSHFTLSLPNGVYFVKISNGSQFNLKKIVVSK